jgi:hypothetical protein
MSRRGLIQRSLEPPGETLRRGRIRPPHARRRHHARTQLANRLLPQIGVRADRAQIGVVERHIRRLHALVVAAHAVRW